jgi:hypothetical protein
MIFQQEFQQKMMLEAFFEYEGNVFTPGTAPAHIWKPVCLKHREMWPVHWVLLHDYHMVHQ